jgi:hypothetical protein
MILSYSHITFPDLIERDIKIHTLRLDKTKRWKPGRPIQHWMYSPRHTQLNPYQFCKDKYGICISVQRIILTPLYNHVCPLEASIDNKMMSQEAMHLLAHNDGFENIFKMKEWFFPEEGPNQLWQGRIIHWTDFKY